jgi:hypothetical protein
MDEESGAAEVDPDAGRKSINAPDPEVQDIKVEVEENEITPVKQQKKHVKKQADLRDRLQQSRLGTSRKRKRSGEANEDRNSISGDHQVNVSLNT